MFVLSLVIVISTAFLGILMYQNMEKKKEKLRKKERKIVAEMLTCAQCPGAHMTLHKKSDHCICITCVSNHKIHRKLPLPLVQVPVLPQELTIISIMGYLTQMKIRKSVVIHCKTLISKSDMTLVKIIQEMITMGTEIDKMGTKDEYANAFEVASLATALLAAYGAK